MTFSEKGDRVFAERMFDDRIFGFWAGIGAKSFGILLADVWDMKVYSWKGRRFVFLKKAYWDDLKKRRELREEASVEQYGGR